MRNYTIEIIDTGEAWDIVADRANDATHKVLAVMDSRGQSVVVQGDWEADGENDDGEQCVRKLFWADDAGDNAIDAGDNAICKLCAVDA